VVVITGGSSGFGRAAALAFARTGARLSLAARGRDALEDTAQACQRDDAETLVVTADVGDADVVDRLASRTVERFGQIDVWVNNAGVILYGRFEETPADDFERVVRTNLLGQVHGARAALRQIPPAGAWRADQHGLGMGQGQLAAGERLCCPRRRTRRSQARGQLHRTAGMPDSAAGHGVSGRRRDPCLCPQPQARSHLRARRTARRGIPPGRPRPVPQAASAVLRERDVGGESRPPSPGNLYDDGRAAGEATQVSG
jgi:NAD(P)-dependent dehydrogenase (short-subunit alcohol dehydrogenase family)